MTEHELIPVLAWLAFVTLASWLAPSRLRPLMVAIGGVVLLGYESPPSLAMLGVFTLVSYGVAHLKRHRGAATTATIAAIAVVYAILLWGSAHKTGLALIVPVGMAYYVLRTIHYLTEAHLGRLRPHGLTDYATYQFLPSTLLFGPTHRFDEFQRDLARRRWDEAEVSRGLGRILVGGLKVVLIGNYLIVSRLGYSATTDLTAGGLADIYRHNLLYWANLYFLFGGYSDVAIGFALLMGFSIRENFNWPFLASNIGEFWRRWHMSLSTWCRDYVYMPAMAATRVHILAISASMLTLGLWHAISLHYVLWALYHALGLTFWRRFSAWSGPTVQAWPRPARLVWTGTSILVTLHFVIFSFVATGFVEHLIARI